ncbi:MAG: GtrA family protein [Solirubrobacterales bacterium]|nr:GtrA family protein [Solirubrobacterales bacterium]
MLARRFREILRHPLRGRITRFAISSGVAAATSAVVFPVLYVLGASTTACTILAFFAGAIPNWTLNRRWTWKVQGRVAWGREIVAYLVISASTLLALSLATGWTNRQVQQLPAHHGIRAMRAEVTAAVKLEQPQYQASELMISAALHGFRLAEVPTTMRDRGVHATGTKKGGNFGYGVRFARAALRTWMRDRKAARTRLRPEKIQCS